MITAWSEAPTYPMPRVDPFNPPPQLTALRAERPLCPVTLWDGSRAWLLTRYQDVRSMLADQRVSADPRSPGYPFLSEARATAPDRDASFNHLDPPDHDLYRRMVGPEFTVQRVLALRPRIERIVDELIDRLLTSTPPVDLVAELALPVPSSVICALLGVPYKDHTFFETHTAARMRLDSEPERVRTVNREIVAYLEQLVARKSRTLGDDLISRMCVRHVHNGALTSDALVDIVRLLLVNGFETTANMISLGVLMLLCQPRPPAAFGVGVPKAGDTATAGAVGVDAVVEELLRHQTIVHIAPTRAVLADLTLYGRTIRAGEGVITSLASANRDRSVFDQPDMFDPTRPVKRHLAFGYGMHHCLGHPLARLELRIVIDTLFRRIPGLRLAVPLRDVRFKHDMGLYGVYRLPVTW